MNTVEFVDADWNTLWSGVLRWVPRIGERVQMIDGTIMEVKHVTYLVDNAHVVIEVKPT